MLSVIYQNVSKAVPSGTQLDREAFSIGLNKGLDDLHVNPSAAAMRLKILATAMQIILFSAFERNERAYAYESLCLAKINSLNAVFSSMGLPLFSCDQVAQDHKAEVTSAIKELSMTNE